MGQTSRMLVATQKRALSVAFVLTLATASVTAVATVDCLATSPITESTPTSNVTQPPDLETLRIGMSTALSGPAAELGINMRDGVLAAFAEPDTQRALAGRKLELIALDDGYEPERTTPNMHQLTSDLQVLAVVGNVGTPTAATAIPIAKRSNTPFFGAFTGASVLRDESSNDFIINYRASYAQETAAMVNALVSQGINVDEIGFFTQNDSYGDDGFFGGLAAIRRHHAVRQSAVPHGRYRRNTLHVEDGLADLMMHQPLPKAIIMVGTYAPCSKLIRLAHEHNYNPQFLAVSFVGSEALQRTLGSHSEGVIVTQVVPHFSSDLPLVQEYRDAMRAYDPELPLSCTSLEGYVVGRILIKAVASIPGQVTRAAINDALENLGEFDIGLDTKLTLGPNDHQASDKVWPVILSLDSSGPIDWETPQHD